MNFLIIDDWVNVCTTCFKTNFKEYPYDCIYELGCDCDDFNFSLCLNEDYGKLININKIESIMCIACAATKDDEPHFLINNVIHCNIYKFDKNLKKNSN